RACQDLRVVAYEDGFLADPPRFVQRIAAVREPLPVQPRAGAEPAPTRYRL
ncbi:MAG: SAM-dependent methyltransferase, partial [Rhodoferax sp.]|nr:SAM-dependent methyltransferase [Rhodoferax sp.]